MPRNFGAAQFLQRGVVTIEAAVLMPVLLLLCAGLLSMGIRLSNYMYLNQIGRELVLQMASVRCLANFSSTSLPATYTYTVGPDLYYPPPPSETQVSSCLASVASSCPDVSSGCPLNVLHYLAVNLMKSKTIRVQGNVTMQYSFGPAPSDPTSGVCIMTVRFSAQDLSWMNFIGGPITTVAQGPYLSTPVPDAGNQCVF